MKKSCVSAAISTTSNSGRGFSGRGLDANVDKRVEFAVMTGCNPLFSLTAVRSFLDLLKYFKVKYTFLSKEVCCGRPIREGMLYNETAADDKQKYENFIRDSLLRNVTETKKFGAKTIINICPGCDMTWNLYGSDLGIDILYYTEFLLSVFKRGKLEKEIDFYEGCHRVHKLSPESLDRGISTAKELLSRIDGLKYHEVSSDMCCRVVPADIFAACKTGKLVTPSQCCYSIGMAARPDNGPEVKFLAEMLYEAVKDR